MGDTGGVHGSGIDLHCHTNASDGTDTPAELVARAAAAGLDVVAITDHDTVAGWAEAEAALPTGLTLVRGAELSCVHHGEAGDESGEISVHLLAHLFDPSAPELADELTRLRGDRARRARVMAQRMADDGLPIDPEAVLAAAGESVGRPHLGQALVAAGYVRTMDEAFAGVLAQSSPYYEAKQDLALMTAVRMVTAAGGVSTLAHARARTRGGVLSEATLAALGAAGMTGLEVDHPEHTPPDRARLREVADELGLVATGSSDYHGSNKTVSLGAETTSADAFTRLVARARGVDLVTGG
ncbi:MAG: PHP domain-containing protein [Mycobacteriaceae bacterium]